MSGLVALVLSLALTPAVLLLLSRWHVLDRPTARSSHDRPVVRGGGLAVALAAVSAWFIAGTDPTVAGVGIVVAAAALGTIGLAEDLFGIPALARLLLQIGASALACGWLLSNLQGPFVWRVIFGGGAVLWLAAYANGFF
jgi:UDP-GlcNAc:undecaprenyl-phosphate/decaprenyl-phosphate GlcNAc-1-phosphate transferase